MSSLFRTIALLCLASIIVLSAFSYFGKVSTVFFAIASGIIAVTASILEILSNRPIGKEDVAVAVDKVLLTYDEDTLRELKKAREEQQKLRNFIEHRSNEIFLLKLRAYLEEAIIARYRNSEIARLVDELTQVEAQLDAARVEYEEVELPERFKRILAKLERQERLSFYLDLIDAIPFFPLKGMYKAAVRLRYSYWEQRAKGKRGTADNTG